MERDKLTATISMSRKVNLGNYESADAFLSVGGIALETTEEDVIALLDGPVKETFEILKTRLRAQVSRMRNEGGQ
jgi:hypothetical protein